MSNQKRNLIARLPLALAALMALFVTPVEAGSVFMKNGYILQGNIVDRDTDSIVLGWANGTVTIARRFVSSIVFDAIEEQQLQELEAIRRELADSNIDAAQMFIEGDEAEDLPATLEGFMRTFNIPGTLTTPAQDLTALEPTDVSSVSLVEPVSVVEQPTPVDPTVSVDVIERERLEAEFFQAERWGFSLRPPMGWTATVLENAVQLKGEATEGGFTPSLSILVFEVGALSPVEYTDLLKAEQESQLKAYHLIDEHSRSFGGQEGVELIASGRYSGRDAIVRQGLLVRDGKVWLFSGVTTDREPEGPFGLVDESLATLQFDAESGN